MDSAEGIRCLNCGTLVSGDQAKLYAEVLVCPDCYAVAERIYERGMMLLRRINILFRDTIRWSLTKGKLRLPHGTPETAGDAELLQRIVGLFSEQAAQCPIPNPQTSSKSSEPAAPTPAAASS